MHLPRFVASRVRSGDDAAGRCFLDVRDSRVSVSGLAVPKSVVHRGCLLIPLRPTCRQLLSRTEQFPACLGFGTMHVKMAARTPSLHLSRKLWQSRHELSSCHQVLCHSAPATISNCGVHPLEWTSEPSGFCCNSASCLSDAQKVSSILQLGGGNFRRKVQ